MKYTVANNESNLGGKNGLYCFLPYERLDDEKKTIFKCGMTTQDFADRLENYHSHYPMGVYLCFFLSPARMKRGQDKEKTIREMERLLFDCVEEVGDKRMKFPTRPSSKWDFSSEWFYTSFSELSDAFEKVHDAYPGSILQQFNICTTINKNYKKNIKAKDKYVAEIAYFV